MFCSLPFLSSLLDWDLTYEGLETSDERPLGSDFPSFTSFTISPSPIPSSKPISKPYSSFELYSCFLTTALFWNLEAEELRNFNFKVPDVVESIYGSYVFPLGGLMRG